MKIITDTATLYTPAQGERIDAEVLPLSVTINNKAYREFVEIESEEFLQLVKAGGIPTSSQPAVGDYIESFERNKEEELLVLALADGLSGAYQTALGVKENYDYGDNIHIVNTKTLCGPHRYIFQKAMSLKNKGLCVNEIITELHDCIDDNKSFLIPADFGFLKRGGRLTPITATIGGLLKIVPILTQTEDGKRLESFALKKTFKSAIQEIITHFKEHGINENYKIYIAHADNWERASKAADMIHAVYKNVDIEMLDFSPAFITQGGPKCIAIQYVKM